MSLNNQQNLPQEFLENYTNLGFVGCGTYGHVFKIQCKKTQKIFAAKQILIKHINWGISSQNLKEISFLRKLKHQNIVQLFDVEYIQDKGQIILILEYMQYDLQKFLRADKTLEINQIKSLSKQILQGLDFCHQNNIMHRDIKPSNLLVNQNGTNLKLTDFGLSTNFNKLQQKLNPQVGSLYYQAPEILLKLKNYDTKYDIWSFGCIFAEMFYGRPIFSGKTNLEILSKILQTLGFEDSQNEQTNIEIQKLLKKKQTQIVGKGFKFISDKNSNFNQQANSLLESVLKISPQSRPSCSELLQHEFFSQLFFQEFSNLQKFQFTTLIF